MNRSIITGAAVGLAVITVGGVTLGLMGARNGPAGAEAATVRPMAVVAPPPGEEPTLPPISDDLRSPARGSAERAQLMDTLRIEVAPQLGGEVIFVVRELKVRRDWAFGVLEPVRPDGSPIDMDGTPIVREAGGADMFDGLRTEAVWRRGTDGWRLVDHGIGATDVWYEGYCGEAPAGLIAACDQRPAPRATATSADVSLSPGMTPARIDRLTTWAVLLGRAVGCGMDVSPQIGRVGAWLDQVAPPGSADQRIYLPMFMSGVEQNAHAQASGRSPDDCGTVARVVAGHPWP